MIEQAKGMIGEQAGLEMDQAFTLLRSHARITRVRLVALAGDILDGKLTAGALDGRSPRTARQ